ncbi:DUF4132 domain-containing protein [Mycolicibacterium fortuitum]|uniref:DUF4132 domain-containing protein n=1 Tax=Mycolicibacterium fortuitum TaxID=1766 RepID=UPI00241CBC87|nr:DUF4132 domain-containing protein [Mycolicibacterium fortuitum]MDG5770968.1 DUF4132 domain-containing protein [Mycolicibacterium fortuitum]MDG5782555.1 DUF4132 domain-containing protein [Mycolicibacterium fortuitum]
MVMSPSWRRSILPRRDGPEVPIADVRDGVVANIRTAIFETRRGDVDAVLAYRGMIDRLATAGRRFLESGDDPEGAAVVAGLRVTTEADPADWVDFWIADYGIAFAAQAVMRCPRTAYRHWSSSDFPMTSAWPQPADRLGLARRVRARLTQISAAEYENAMRQVDGARDTPRAKCAAAFMFPTNRDWVTEACRSPVGLSEDRSRLELLTSVDSIDDVHRLLFTKRGDSFYQDYRHILPTLVDRFGDLLVPILDRLLREYLAKERAGTVAEALACLPGDAAFETLLRHSGLEGVRPGLARAVRNFPQRAERLLAERDDDLARQLLGPAEPAPAVSSQACALPELLADPPWQRTAKTPKLPVPSRPLQAPSPELAWTDEELTVARRFAAQPPKVMRSWADIERHREQSGEWICASDILVHGPDRLVEHLVASGWTPQWRSYFFGGWFGAALLRLGPRLDYLALAYADKCDDVAYLGPVRSELVATRIAEWLCGQRRSLIAVARAYLHRHGAAIAPFLVPAAAGPAGTTRSAAHTALRYLATHSSAEAVIAAVRGHDADAVPLVAAVLDVDPLLILPKRVPRLPDWARPALATPVLLADGTQLPFHAVESVAVMLMLSGPVLPYAGVAQLAKLCDVRSLNALSWALFDAWWTFGAPGAHKWALDALAWFADDESVDRIADMVKAWPSQGRGGRLPHGLDVLSTIGTDHALLTLFRLSKKGRSKPLKDKAAERLSQIAVARGLSDEQMADRLIPDLGLDEASAAVFDYGTRRFTVEFDELLQLVVRDQNGARLRSFPKPGVRDDAEIAEESHRRFTRLKREVRVVAKEQLPRLETAMTHERRWTTAEFEMIFVNHPVMVHLARRLVWGQFDESGALATTFRIAEDRSYADVDDTTTALEPGLPVGIVHPLHGSLAAWAEVFADYEILQPFPQVAREVIRATADDLASQTLGRFSDARAETFALLGLASRGWVVGEALDGPVRHDISRPAPRSRSVEIWVDPGIPFDPREVESQTIQVAVSEGTFGDLGVVFTSEVVTDVTGVLSR